ncbi:MAG: hypothetical protein VCC04_15485, partial [Myxococcota bacterium]
MLHFLPTRWRVLPAAVAVGVCLQWGGELARADVYFDGTVGPGGPGVAPPLDDYTFSVEAARGEQAGGNLFHSFSEFSLDPNESVVLFGEGDFSNVFLRVSSQVDLNGEFWSQHQGADVFLLSPQGIRIGPSGAFVDLPAGLTLSTANGVLFPDGSFPVSSAVWSPGGCCGGSPTALVFAGGDPATDPALLEMESLVGSPEPGSYYDLFEGLRLVAGRIVLGGRRLGSARSVIRLTATGQASVEISLDPDAPAPWLEELGPDALIEIDGVELDARLGLNENGVPGRIPGGRILLEGGQLRLAGDTDLKAGGDASGPAITLRASESIELDYSRLQRPADVPDYAPPLTSGPGIEVEAPRIVFQAGATPDGRVGPTRVRSFRAPIRIRGHELDVTGGSYVQVIGLTPDGGGLVTDASDFVGLHVAATDAVRVEGRGSLVSQPDSEMDGGDIHVEAGSLEVLDGG